jgi:phosphoribosylformylglycinamidine synthase subunit PurQ / glutaminase
MLKALVLAGDGINCERETEAAARESGFGASIIHVNDLLRSRGSELASASLVVIPGGFSFGDELGSGKILALKLKHGLGDALERYLDAGGAMLGICNGFQVLTRLGIFGQSAVLAQNASGHFQNRWVGLELSGKSIFTDGLRKAGVTRLELPIRHGEGRFLFADPAEAAEARVNIVLRYETDVNGAWERAAGLTARNGRVLGLMPHPEAFWSEELHPWGGGRKVPLGIELFRSARTELGQGT